MNEIMERDEIPLFNFNDSDDVNDELKNIIELCSVSLRIFLSGILIKSLRYWISLEPTVEKFKKMISFVVLRKKSRFCCKF